MAGLTKSKKVVQRAWRPDFRDVQTLPDTKVIRTGFLLNFIAITVALGSVGVYVVREYSLQSLIHEVRTLESQVAADTSRNRLVLDANKGFIQKAQIIEEAVAFDVQAVSFPDFIAQVSAALQEGSVLTLIEMKNSTLPAGKSGIPPFVVELRGKVLEGAPVTPSQLLNNFQAAILSIDALAGKDVDMEMVNFGRNNEFGHFDFTLLVKIAVEKAPSL